MLCHFCGIETDDIVDHPTQQSCERALEKALKRLRRTMLAERHARYLSRRNYRDAAMEDEAVRAHA